MFLIGVLIAQKITSNPKTNDQELAEIPEGIDPSYSEGMPVPQSPAQTPAKYDASKL